MAVAPPTIDLVLLAGTLSSDPVDVELPSGDRLVRYEVTVRSDGPTRTVPVAWPAPARPPTLHAGDHVVVLGSVRRRFFRAGGGTRSATEVLADRVVAARSRARARDLADRARAAIAAAFDPDPS